MQLFELVQNETADAEQDSASSSSHVGKLDLPVLKRFEGGGGGGDDETKEYLPVDDVPADGAAPTDGVAAAVDAGEAPEEHALSYSSDAAADHVAPAPAPTPASAEVDAASADLAPVDGVIDADVADAAPVAVEVDVPEEQALSYSSDVTPPADAATPPAPTPGIVMVGGGVGTEPSPVAVAATDMLKADLKLAAAAPNVGSDSPGFARRKAVKSAQAPVVKRLVSVFC
jgi:hypothetical protein